MVVDRKIRGGEALVLGGGGAAPVGYSSQKRDTEREIEREEGE